MTFSTSFSKTENSKADTIVAGVFESGVLSSATESLDKRTGGMISTNLNGHRKFKGKSGQALSMAISVDKAVRIVLIGLGKADGLNTLSFETMGGKLFDTLKSSSAVNIDVHLDGIEDLEGTTTAEAASHLAFGFKLKSYRFDKYKTKTEDSSHDIENLCVVTDAHTAAKKRYETLDHIAKGVFLARDLVNEPPNTLHPESYAELIKEELKPLGVEVEILDEKKMHKLGFEALLAVGQGSIRESRTVIMRWNGAGKGAKASKRAPIALVGKGVTFDTGGISLKPGAEMDLMKMDMGGSAAVVGVMKALAARKANANVIGIVGLVENMPSDRAYRPGDVIGSLAGKTIEILNTDAEGRLVLADILTYIQQTYKPEVIIDLATLTGAIMIALGFEYCGAFANDDGLWDQLNDSSKNTGEKFWRMPLDAAYKKEMESDIADLKNLGSLGRYGGACSAAGFLEHFIEEDTKWAHIDIAGTAWWKSDAPTTPKGGTGFPVRALNDLIEKHFEK
jgi:leucyl aminopeptidase